MEFDCEPNTAVGRGYGRKVTPDECEALLREADALGLYHTAEKHGICNCCRCCCYPGRTTLELGYKGLWPKILYTAIRDAGHCAKCAKCVERCPKDALHIEDGQVGYNPDKCWGCGLCETGCPEGAITMAKLEK